MFKTNFSPLDGQTVHKEHERNFAREAEMDRLAHIAQPSKARLSFTLLGKIWRRMNVSNPPPIAPNFQSPGSPDSRLTTVD